MYKNYAHSSCHNGSSGLMLVSMKINGIMLGFWITILLQGSGWKVVASFEGNFPNRIKQLPLDRHFDLNNVKRVWFLYHCNISHDVCLCVRINDWKLYLCVSWSHSWWGMDQFQTSFARKYSRPECVASALLYVLWFSGYVMLLLHTHSQSCLVPLAWRALLLFML